MTSAATPTAEHASDKIVDRHTNGTRMYVLHEVCCTETRIFSGERFNVFSHLLGGVLLVILFVVRLVLISFGVISDSPISQFQNSVIVFSTIVFLVSCVYHVYKADRRWSRWLRALDYFCIYTTMSVQTLFVAACVGDVPLVVGNVLLSDPLMLLYVAFAVMVLREWTLDEQTFQRITACPECGYQHSDGANTVVRVSTSTVFAMQWLLYLGSVVRSIPSPYSWLYLATQTIATIIITVSQANDYFNMTLPLQTKCPMPYAHGIFHIAALIAFTIVLTMNELLVDVCV